MKFQKFASIENSYRNKDIARVAKHVSDLYERVYVLEEKRDGTNFSFYIARDELKFATRQRILGIEDKFYDYKEVVNNDKNKRLVEQVRSYLNANSAIDHIILHGELFGVGIQKRINYGIGKYYEVFNVRFVMKDESSEWLSPEEVRSFLEEIDCLDSIIPTIAIVSNLHEALNWNVEEQRTIDPENHFEHINNSFAEGIVIKPYADNVFDHNNGIFFLKKKSDKFKERTKQMHMNKTAKDIPEDVWKLQISWSSYLNDNRVLSVFSKIGQIESHAQIGMYIKEIIADAREEFMKDFGAEFNLLNKDDARTVFKVSGHIIVPILERFLNKNE
jgi:Rnl2 family RNA ligase